MLDTAEFSRLRQIKQLSTVYFFHKHATHTRYDHSVGVAALIKSFIAAQPALEIGIFEQFLLVAAGLLHDIGHASWSHVGEAFTCMRTDVRGMRHDQLSGQLVLGETKYDEYFSKWNMPRVRDIIEDEDTRLMIAEMIAGRAPIVQTDPNKPLDEDARKKLSREKAYLGNMIHGPLDFDRAEFIIRDSFMTLSGTGQVNVGRILEDVGIVETSEGARILSFLSLHAAESMVSARELLYQGVYLEARNVVAEELLIRALLRAYPNGTDITEFWFSTDSDAMEKLHALADTEKDIFVKRVCNLMRNCRTYDVFADMNLHDKRLNNVSRKNIKYLGSDLGGHRLLDVEQQVQEKLKSSNVTLGDFVIGCCVWKRPQISEAAVRVGSEDSTLDYESHFLRSLGNEDYENSRSRLVIGGEHGLSDKKEKVVEAVLDQLKTTDYA